MKIGNIDTQEKVFIIAEIGNNHEGSYELAEKMIGMAADSGADAVKFQTIIPERLVSIRQLDRIKQLERFQLTYEEFKKLSFVAKDKGIMFLSTPFDIDSAIFLNDILPAFKIASSDNDFFPLIEVIARTGKPIILSTGLMKLNEVKTTVSFIKKIWNDLSINQNLALLHCVSSYPTQTNDANISAIRDLNNLAETVGYSDHTLGLDAAILSVASGARIIEKHFTIDNNFSTFHDHKISLNPKHFKKLVKEIRNAELILGGGSKVPSLNEQENKVKFRRSIVAKHKIEKGQIITIDNLDWVRPGDGMNPGEEKKILNRKAIELINKGCFINLKNTKER
jgi:N-acetylneuraminate synthase/N,N'-diacetyllegionaminate synthase